MDQTRSRGSGTVQQNKIKCDISKTEPADETADDGRPAIPSDEDKNEIDVPVSERVQAAKLGLVQHLPGFQPMPVKVKDSISLPKPNGYQSPNTALRCGGQSVEVQLRTSSMHQVAKYNSASHFAYIDKMKATKGGPRSVQQAATWSDGGGAPGHNRDGDGGPGEASAARSAQQHHQQHNQQ